MPRPFLLCALVLLLNIARPVTSLPVTSQQVGLSSSASLLSTKPPTSYALTHSDVTTPATQDIPNHNNLPMPAARDVPNYETLTTLAIRDVPSHNILTMPGSHDASIQDNVTTSTSRNVPYHNLTTSARILSSSNHASVIPTSPGLILTSISTENSETLASVTTEKFNSDAHLQSENLAGNNTTAETKHSTSTTYALHKNHLISVLSTTDTIYSTSTTSVHDIKLLTSATSPHDTNHFTSVTYHSDTTYPTSVTFTSGSEHSISSAFVPGSEHLSYTSPLSSGRTVGREARSHRDDQYTTLQPQIDIMSYDRPMADALPQISTTNDFKLSGNSTTSLKSDDGSPTSANVNADDTTNAEEEPTTEDPNLLTTTKDVCMDWTPGTVNSPTHEYDGDMLTISWSPAHECNVSYEVEVTLMSGDTLNTSSVTCNSTACKVQPNFKCYNVSVTVRTEGKIFVKLQLNTAPAPITITESSVSTNAATLTFTEPAYNSNCNTLYYVSYTDVITKITTNSSSPCAAQSVCELNNLDPCSKYEITVTPMWGDKFMTSPTKVEVTTEDYPTIRPPNSVHWMPLGPHEINVTWTRDPDESPRCARRYHVQFEGGLFPTDNTHYKLHRLVSCKVYPKLEVWASSRNNHIISEIKSVTHLSTVAAPADDHIQYIKYDEGQEVFLNWKQAEFPHNNKCPVDRVKMTCTKVSPGTHLSTEKSSQTGLTFANLFIRNLEPLKHYICGGQLWHGNLSTELQSLSFSTPDDNLSPALIVFISCIAAIFSVLAIFGALLLLRRGYPDRCRKLLDTLLGGIPLQPNVMAQCARPPSAIRTEVFEEHCSALAQSAGNPGNTGFTAQFRLLGALSPLPVSAQSESYSAGMDPENKVKNRYINILPYDSTRVRIAEMDDDPCSDYVNANFIKGYSDEIEYIASQGPMEGTCEDFWRMVFEHDVSVIAMVTNLEEKEKEKCYQYYPNLRETADFGSVTVQSTSEVNLPIFTRRNLLVVKGDVNKSVLHLHFREWPDFGCPASTDLMLNFCHVMRQNMRDEGLILVHCSAGVGRTGTLIAVDILTQHIQKNNKIDVFGTVLKLRQQRINMVQTEGQYRYIHHCIKDALQDPTLLNPDLSDYNSSDVIHEEKEKSDSFLAVKEDTGTTSEGEEECEDLLKQEMDSFLVVKQKGTNSEGESSV